MRSGSGDLTARAVIRDEAMRLFAERGPDAVTIREIASAASVSPALVVHHFGSKARLRQVVDERVAQTLDGLIDDLAESGLATGSPAASFTDLLLRRLPPGSPVPAYVRRLLLAGDRAGIELFRRWHESSLRLLTDLSERGAVRPSPDPPVRAAFLLANDLAVLLLRDQLAAVMGEDPLSPDGLARWAREVVSVYAGGSFISQEGP
jgi:TetR/AcrR family transcriptional regulator, regulator of cefoperazone and chloramphenicol sensitivity